MDLTQGAAYRWAQLNNAKIDDQRIIGTQINDINVSELPAVGYTEKSALTDGLDASDIYQGGRRITITGQTNGSSRGNAFDRFQDILYAFNPTLAMIDHAEDKGFAPFTFKYPTADPDVLFGDTSFDAFIRCRPARQVAYDLNRDRSGGKDSAGLAIPWVGVLEAIDPRIYVDEEQTVDLAGVTSSGTINPTYRTLGRSGMDITLETGVLGTARTLTLNEQDATTVIILPVSAAAQTLIYNSQTRRLTHTSAGVTTIRMDLIDFQGSKRPYASAGLGISVVVTADVLVAGSQLSWFEALP